MATYQDIKGLRVKYLSADPADPAGGEVWYNSTTGTLKSVITVSGFSSAAPINQARGYLGGITGTGATTAGLIFGGNAGSPTAPGNDSTEEYNGSGWSTSGNLGTGRLCIGGFGIQTAAVGMGGRTPGAGEVVTTEEYNGTAWTAGGDLGTARRYLSGAGTLTSGLAFAGTTGGAPGAGTAQTVTEEYDGSSWAAGGALGTARQRGCGTGASQTAAICFGGSVPPVTGNTEVYDGSTWSEQNNMNSGKASAMGWGLSTLAMATGGETSTASYTTTTEDWNGTSWLTNPATLPTGNQAMAGQGSTTAGLLAGGWIPAPVGNTSLEYNSSTSAITAAAWASGALMGAGRYRMNGQNVGTKDAGMAVGGRGSFPSTAPAVTVSSVEEYDGSTWSEVNNMPTSLDFTGMIGIQTAAVQFGGYGGPGAGPNPAPGGSRTNATNEYDGTSWATTGAYPASINGLSGAGTQTAGVGFGGSDGSASNVTAEYNGASWAAGNNLGTARDALGGTGIQTAALAIGGPPSPETRVEEYDGTNWATGGALPTGSNQNGTGGTQTNALLFGGNVSPTTLVLGYDGTSWSTRPSISTARYGGSSGNNTTTGTYYAGGGGSASGTQRQTTEEFTSETSAVNIETLTTS